MRTDEEIRVPRALGAAHPSGGTVIERVAIVAEGADLAEVVAWIRALAGHPETAAASSPRVASTVRGSASRSDRRSAHGLATCRPPAAQLKRGPQRSPPALASGCPPRSIGRPSSGRCSPFARPDRARRATRARRRAARPPRRDAERPRLRPRQRCAPPSPERFKRSWATCGTARRAHFSHGGSDEESTTTRRTARQPAWWESQRSTRKFASASARTRESGSEAFTSRCRSASPTLRPFPTARASSRALRRGLALQEFMPLAWPRRRWPPHRRGGAGDLCASRSRRSRSLRSRVGDPWRPPLTRRDSTASKAGPGGSSLRGSRRPAPPNGGRR